MPCPLRGIEMTMDPSNRARVEAWLRYGEDLGLGPYYRDRAGTGIRSAALPTSEAKVEMPATALPVAAMSSRKIPAPPSVPSPASKPAAAISILGGDGGASLFGGAERIEGDTLERIREDIGPNCTRCKLHKSRKKIVFGVGNPKADLVFIGEGPGRDEDIQGEPFVGRAGKLLTQMIEAMSLRREDVYICNVVKCRPPENRLPEK